MKYAMISQPMNNKSDEEIKAVRAQATEYLESLGYTVVNSYFADQYQLKDAMQVANPPVYFLSKSIERMAECHAVYFANGWENARGCKIEHEIAVAYGIEVLYEKS